jgi:hypothetical protein
MEVWLLPVVAFASGLMIGLASGRRFRRDRIAWAQRRLQLVALSLEVKSLRAKVVPAQSNRTPPAKRRLVRRRPSLTGWQRWFIGSAHRLFPWITRFMRFTPTTYIQWLQGKSRKSHADKIAEGKRRGRPSTPEFIVEAILTIKRENSGYSARRIANIISGGELRFRIGRTVVCDILKANGFKPGPKKGKLPPREEEPGWVTTLYNQHVMAFDFKTILDLKGDQLYILNIIDHGRRVLHWSRATYSPSAAWVAQQLRNAFMDMDDLPEAMVMDRDQIFLPIARRILPAMNIKVVRTAYKCPWQNAVVERFHRTLDEELLRYVQPHHDRHLNRLLREFRRYYNTARPHMHNGGVPPIAPDLSQNPAANDPDFFNKPPSLVRRKWLGGLHSSYRWAA